MGVSNPTVLGKYLNYNNQQCQLICLFYANILFRVSLKRFFASGRAEVIRLSFIDTGEFCCFLINLHLTNRVNRHVFSPPPLAGGIYRFNNNERVMTVTELSAMASPANSGRNVTPKNG